MGETGKKMLIENGHGLESLPDAILICILSLLPTNIAARTSILSRRWRNLWTRVNSVEFEGQYSNRSPSIYSILCRITSSVIRRFIVVATDSEDIFSDVQCFPILCEKKVEEIKVTSSSFSTPACIFQCETLVTLHLNISKGCKIPKLISFNLPKLKKLSLTYGLRSFERLAMLLDSCPMLEDLDMVLDFILRSNFINIPCPSLKSLCIDMYHPYELHKIIIDAPKLTNIRVSNAGSLVYLVTDPTELITANLDLTYLPHLAREKGMDEDDYLREICKFVGRLSTIRNFHVTGNIKLFTYLHSVNSLPTFENLTYVTTTLNHKYDGNDLLVLLQISPNLEHVVVTLDYEAGSPLSDMRYSLYPYPMLNNLDIVHLFGLRANVDEINFIGNILGNGIALDRVVMRCFITKVITNKNTRSGMEFNFYKACTKLPRKNSETEISFSGEYVTATTFAAPRPDEFIVRV